MTNHYRGAFYRPVLDDTLIYQNNSQLTSGEMNTLATAYKACSGQGKNQSILALFTIPKNDSIHLLYSYFVNTSKGKIEILLSPLYIKTIKLMKLQFIPFLWYTWEVSASCSQGISHWGHGQHNVEIVGTLVDKELPDHLFNMRTTCSCSLLTNLIKVMKRYCNIPLL